MPLLQALEILAMDIRRECTALSGGNTDTVIMSPEQMTKSLTARRTAHAIGRVTGEQSFVTSDHCQQGEWQ
jgi:hypothetical protein